MIDPTERELAGIEFLDSWPWETGGVLIGGYALAAYGSPRFSIDVDLVVTENEHRSIRPHLKLRTASRRSVPGQSSTGRPLLVERLIGELQTVDLLINGVIDRVARVPVDAEWIERDPVRRRLALISGRTRATVSVARIEVIWLLKLLAGRRTDISDLLSLSGQEIDVREVRGLLGEHVNESLKEHVNRLRSQLASPRTYSDALSRLARGSPSHRSNRETWEKFLAKVNASLPSDSG